jgi:error-prone DNA polymerase
MKPVSDRPGSVTTFGSPAADPRGPPPKPRDVYDPDLHIDTIKVKTRDFR